VFLQSYFKVTSFGKIFNGDKFFFIDLAISVSASADFPNWLKIKIINLLIRGLRFIYNTNMG
jgi:hypothetical protein